MVRQHGCLIEKLGEDHVGFASDFDGATVPAEVKRSASQVARATGAMSSKGLVRVRVKLAGARVTLDGGVELLGIKGFEPGTKAGQLARRELLNGFLDILGGRHGQNISFTQETEAD